MEKDYPQTELNHLRQKVLDLSAWRDQVRMAWEKWKQFPVMNCEKMAAQRSLSQVIDAGK